MGIPFLEYLTVFRSRLGAANILLRLTGLSHLPEETLLRKTREFLEQRIPLDATQSENEFVFRYLKDKGLIPDEPNPSSKALNSNASIKGRYNGFGLSKQDKGWNVTYKRTEHGPSETRDKLPVFQTDLWMADPRIRSTIGVPTPDNAKEIIDLTYQLHLLSRGKVTWTSAGYLIHTLRGYRLGQANSDDGENPFLLDIGSAAFLRQIIECDGLLIRELLRTLCAGNFQSPTSLVKRDDIAAEFGNIVKNAVEASRRYYPRTTLYEANQYKKFIEKTTEKRSGQSRGPGVLEHRVSPRLEWLVDLGYLSKEGLSKNSFTYRLEPAANSLLDDLDKFAGEARWAESVAISQWLSNPIWRDLRLKVRVNDRLSVFLKAYKLLQKPVGPSPLNDVAFISALLLATTRNYYQVEREIMNFAQTTDGVTLSGGRTQRGPQNIYISDNAIQKLKSD
jgi:hypothetical protein